MNTIFTKQLWNIRKDMWGKQYVIISTKYNTFPNTYYSPKGMKFSISNISKSTKYSTPEDALKAMYDLEFKGVTDISIMKVSLICDLYLTYHKCIDSIQSNPAPPVLTHV